jgi:SAM-dependent methyltransferase
VKARVRALDERYTGGRVRRWWNRNAVLGGGWGEFLDAVGSVPDGARVLDIGAGEATLRARVPHARYVAIDRGIGHAGWDYSGLDAVGDAQAIPVAGASFDAVVSKQVLEHLPDPARAVGEIARVLAPGGVALLSTNQQWPQHQKPHDYFRFTSYGLRLCFEQAGLVVEDMQAMGGAFGVLLFQFGQVFSPEIWARSARARRMLGVLFVPIAWLMKLLLPLASALDRLDRAKDNTLGWYVRARKPGAGVPDSR